MKTSFLIVLFLKFCQGLNILVWSPAFAHSHSKFMERIGDTLVEAGHNVTEVVHLLVPQEYRKVSKLTTVRIIPQDPRLKAMSDKHLDGGLFKNLWTSELSPFAMMKMIDELKEIFRFSTENAIGATELWDELRKQKFDVGITEAFDLTGLGLMEMIGVKATISCSSLVMGDSIALLTGVPIVPSYVPGGNGAFSDRMTFLERAQNAFETVLGASFILGMSDMGNKIFREKVRPDFPDLKELAGTTSMILTNSLPYLDFPHPKIHKVIEVGGIGISDRQPLNKEWNDILDRKKINVLISFGSLAKAKDMPQSLKDSIIATVRRFPDVQFIWKYEADDLINLPDNLLLSKWTPQVDLLADKRLSLFVTHGGLGSATEVAYCGTPVVVIPISADQPRNTKMLQRHGIAETISKYDLADPDKLYAVIKKMLEDPSYAENAKRLTELVNNVPFTPKELLVKNVEFVGRFGKLPQLDPYGRHLTFVQYYLLDVAAAIVAMVTLVLILLCVTVKKLVSWCCSRSRTGKTKCEEEEPLRKTQ